MAGEVQIVKIVSITALSGAGIYYIKEIAGNYFELKALSAMPESYWITEQKKAETELKIAEVQEAAETKRTQEELKYKRERDEKDRAQQLEIMEKEKAYPESYWIYKTEKVKTETVAKTVIKTQEASVERQKTLMNALSTGFDIFTRRYL